MINDYSINNTAHSSHLKQNYLSGRLQILVNCLSLGLGSSDTIEYNFRKTVK